jgi:pimeloyl-ACP methyl ester carboxylesterase
MEKNIVLLHGWGARSKKLNALAGNLRKNGWNVYLFDLPGFGNSNLENIYTVKDYSKYVAVRANRFFKGRSFIIFGHSNGGRIAIGLNKYYPKNLKGLILCASGGISRPFLPKRIFFWAMAKAGKVLLVVPALAKAFRKLLYKAAGEHDYEKTYGYLKETLKNILNENTKKNTDYIKIPTLILWGRKDRMTPVRDAKFLNKKIKKSKLVIFKNEGHKLPYLKPKMVSREIDLWFKTYI